MLSLIFISIYKRKNKKRHVVIYYRLLHASRNIKNILLFSCGRAISSPWWLAILLIFQNERIVAHGEMPPFSRRKDRTVPWRHLRFYEWFNGNASPRSPSSQQYLENIPVCTLMLFSSFRWKEEAFGTHLARSSFPLSLLFSLPFRECFEPAASLPYIVKRNTYFVLAHPFAFDNTYAQRKNLVLLFQFKGCFE